MNLIFDFDGTICDSIHSVVRVANDILVQKDLRKTNVSELKKIGLIGLIKSRNISLLKVHSIITKYRNRADSIYETALPFNGIEKIINKLSRNHKLGIVTSNKKVLVEKFLKKHKLSYFIFIHSEKNIFGKDKRLRKIITRYKLNPKQTYYIGDETRDVEAAKKLGIKSIAVCWGAESKKLLEKSGPDFLVSEPAKLLNICK